MAGGYVYHPDVKTQSVEAMRRENQDLRKQLADVRRQTGAAPFQPQPTPTDLAGVIALLQAIGASL